MITIIKRLNHILFFSFLSFELWAHIGEVPKIRVRVSQGHKQVVVSGTDLKRKLHINGDKKEFEGPKSVKFNCQNYLAKNHPSRSQSPITRASLLASLSSKTGLVTVGDNKYRGSVHILSDTNNSGCDIVHEVTLETYIASLLSKEMNGTWELEALKAQAVAARTYALHKMKIEELSKLQGLGTFYDLENSEKHQVSGDFFDATAKTLQAANETRGLVLVDNDGKLVPTFFHAKCGGKTLMPNEVWTNKVEGYSQVVDPFCKGRGPGLWQKKITEIELKDFLLWAGKQGFIKGVVNKNDKIRIAPDRLENFFIRFYLGDKAYHIRKPYLRRYFGRNILSSNRFVLTRELREKNYTIRGEGMGHGVGLCQIGALYMARNGKKFKEILAHYYPGLTLKKKY